jgi:hypothetical protein
MLGWSRRRNHSGISFIPATPISIVAPFLANRAVFPNAEGGREQGAAADNSLPKSISLIWRLAEAASSGHKYPFLFLGYRLY